MKQLNSVHASTHALNLCLNSFTLISRAESSYIFKNDIDYKVYKLYKRLGMRKRSDINLKRIPAMLKIIK